MCARCGDEVEHVLALKAFLNDLHVEQSEEAAAEAEAERDGGLSVERESRVVELELFERVLEVAVLRAVDGIDAAEYHRLSFSVARQRLGGGIRNEGNGVADLRVSECLYRTRDVAYLARVKAVGFLHRRRVHQSALNYVENRAGRHELELVARVYLTLLEADVDDNTLVAVVVAVENQRAERRVGVACRSRNVGNNLLEHGVDIYICLRGDLGRVLGGNADNVLDFIYYSVGVSARQVDLVDDGHDFKSAVDREVRIGEGLSLDSLRSVDDENRSLTGGERTRDLVVEVDVAGSVDEVEEIVLAVVGGVDYADGARLDRDSALTLELHVVEELSLHVARGNGVGVLEYPVRERALAVVNVRDYTEISDFVT